MFHSAGQHEEKLIQNLALLFLIVTHGYFHFSFFIIIVQIGKVNLVGRRNRRIKELCRLFILFLMPSLFTSLHFNILRHLSFTAFLPPFNFSPLTSFLSLSLSLSLSLYLSPFLLITLHQQLFSYYHTTFRSQRLHALMSLDLRSFSPLEGASHNQSINRSIRF